MYEETQSHHLRKAGKADKYYAYGEYEPQFFRYCRKDKVRLTKRDACRRALKKTGSEKSSAVYGKDALSYLISLVVNICPGIKPDRYSDSDMGKQIVRHNAGSGTANGSQYQVDVIARGHIYHKDIDDNKDKGRSKVFAHYKYKYKSRAGKSAKYNLDMVYILPKKTGHIKDK